MTADLDFMIKQDTEGQRPITEFAVLVGEEPGNEYGISIEGLDGKTYKPVA